MKVVQLHEYTPKQFPYPTPTSGMSLLTTLVHFCNRNIAIYWFILKNGIPDVKDSSAG